MKVKKVCIVGGKRIPFAKSGTAYNKKKNIELMTVALNGLIDEYDLNGKEVGEVILGAVNKHSYDFSLARECVMDSKLHPHTPATDIQKACGTSLEAAIQIGNKIALGLIDCGIAGGVDTNSDIPVEFSKKFTDRLLDLNSARTAMDRLKAFKGFNPKELLPKLPAVKEPRTGMSMGESCEEMAKTWDIQRRDQDLLALESHKNASKAYHEGFYDSMIVEAFGLKRDNILREDSTMEKLSKLKPAFDKKSGLGTLTAANSTPLTDGASCVFLCSEEYAKEHNLEVKAYLTFSKSYAVNYINDEGLLMAPAYAVPKLLDLAGLTLQDFDFYEIHEAFAAQVLCHLNAWKSEEFCKNKLGLDSALGEIDMSKLNVKGGSLAIGHPFAATGTRILMSLAEMIHQKGSGRGLISICTAGGMGVTAIVEK